jgi:hypothetical protein
VSYTEGDTGVAKFCQVDKICDKSFLEEMGKIATTEELEKPLAGLSFGPGTA